MKQNVILIVCMDKEYNCSVEYDVASTLAQEYVLETIDDKVYLEKYLKFSHRIDTLIIDEELAGEFCKLQNPSHVYLLYEGDGDNSRINKYEGAQGIIQALGANYLATSSAPEKQITHLVNVISVCGGAGKTTAALGTAYWLSRKGYKVLYVDAEDFQTFSQILGCDAGDDETDRIMSSAIKNLTKDNLKDLIQEDFMNYIKPFYGPLASYGLCTNDYLKIVNQIEEQREFDYIVLEHKAGTIDDEMMRMILKGDSLIIVGRQTENATARIFRFLDIIREYTGQSVVVCGRYQKHRPDNLKDNIKDNDIPVSEYVPELDNDLTMKDIFSKCLLRDTAEAVI